MSLWMSCTAKTKIKFASNRRDDQQRQSDVHLKGTNVLEPQLLCRNLRHYNSIQPLATTFSDVQLKEQSSQAHHCLQHVDDDHKHKLFT